MSERARSSTFHPENRGAQGAGSTERAGRDGRSPRYVPHTKMSSVPRAFRTMPQMRSSHAIARHFAPFSCSDFFQWHAFTTSLASATTSAHSAADSRSNTAHAPSSRTAFAAESASSIFAQLGMGGPRTKTTVPKGDF